MRELAATTTGGVATVPGCRAEGLAVDSQGRILITGMNGSLANLDIETVRLLPNGQIDTACGANGYVTADHSAFDCGYAVAVATGAAWQRPTTGQ